VGAFGHPVCSVHPMRALYELEARISINRIRDSRSMLRRGFQSHSDVFKRFQGEALLYQLSQSDPVS